jgi:hypothetical protein
VGIGAASLDLNGSRENPSRFIQEEAIEVYPQSLRPGLITRHFFCPINLVYYVRFFARSIFRTLPLQFPA